MIAVLKMLSKKIRKDRTAHQRETFKKDRKVKQWIEGKLTITIRTATA